MLAAGDGRGKRGGGSVREGARNPYFLSPASSAASATAIGKNKVAGLLTKRRNP
jgi:hypothetical protein